MRNSKTTYRNISLMVEWWSKTSIYRLSLERQSHYFGGFATSAGSMVGEDTNSAAIAENTITVVRPSDL